MDAQTLQSIRESVLFEGLAAEEIETLAGYFQEKKIEEGAAVYVENMAGESLYLIRKGTVKISKMLAEGEERILVILGPEDVFGEMALIDEKPRWVTARVAEEADLLSLSRSDFALLCDRSPKLGLKIMRNIIRVLTGRMRENETAYREMLLFSLDQP